MAKSTDQTPEETAKFWPLYKDFQRELAVPYGAILRASLDYAAAGYQVTDANAEGLVERILSEVACRAADRHRGPHPPQMPFLLAFAERLLSKTLTGS